MSSPVLTPAQLINLKSIINDGSISKDQRVIKYYQTLASYGYPYGNLALSVATDSTVGGQIGNRFLANKAAANGKVYNQTIASDLRYELAQADLQARENAFGQDISGRDIEIYHTRVYGDHGYTSDYWIGEVPYVLLKENGWQTLKDGSLVSEGLIVAEVAAIANLGMSSGYDINSTLSALDWLANVAIAAGTDLAEALGSAFKPLVNWLEQIFSASQTNTTLLNALNITEKSMLAAMGMTFPNNGQKFLGGYCLPISALFNRAMTDPIVLDLSTNGSGIQLTSLANSKASFDLTGNGFAVRTGWVGPQTGLLAIDKNNNGKIDNITELFGNDATDGFTALKAYDTNFDGRITAADSGFARLRVWTDANGDGITQTGELKSLAELGITGINIYAQPVDVKMNGNLIGAVATLAPPCTQMCGHA